MYNLNVLNTYKCMEDSHSLIKNIDGNIYLIQTSSENCVYLEMQLTNFPYFSSRIGSQIARTYCPRLKSRLYSFFRGWHFLLKIEYSQVWIEIPGGQNSVTIGCRAFAPDLLNNAPVSLTERQRCVFKFAQANKIRLLRTLRSFLNLLVILDTRSILWGGLNVTEKSSVEIM